MALVRTRDTGPERTLRSLLHRQGLRFRVNSHVTGPPRTYVDVLFRSAQVAVFVDGCFWHGCPEHASWPKANARWWREKIAKTRQRDAETTRRLTEEGWLVIRVWEHEDPAEAAHTIAAVVRERGFARSGTGSL